MTFLTMQQELVARLGVFSLTVTDDATKIKRWLNLAQQDVCAENSWPFMIAQEIVQTVVDYITGTCSVNSGSATVTFSATIANSMANRFIKFSSSDDWYQITAHTAGANTATISPAYGQTSNLSAGTFTIRKLFYSTSTPLDSILDIKKTVSGVRLSSISSREADMFLPLYHSTGTPYQYILSVPDSSGNLQFSFLYSPSDPINIYIRGIKKLTDMSADSDNSLVPTRWQSAIIDRAAWYGLLSLDDNRADKHLVAFERTIAKMKTFFTQDLGRHRIMKPVDAETFNGPVWTLPSNFGIEIDG